MVREDATNPESALQGDGAVTCANCTHDKDMHIYYEGEYICTVRALAYWPNNIWPVQTPRCKCEGWKDDE